MRLESLKTAEIHFRDFPRVGELFLGRYRMEAVLGTGGFARVYRAVQQDLGRPVAIKVMRPAVDTDDDLTEGTRTQLELIAERFRREARVISRFRSPQTVVVYDYGRTDSGLLYMILEYVDGRSMRRLIDDEAPVVPQRAVHILKQVLRSLHEAHSFDILHRDIKPQNIMIYDHLDRRDLVKVLDFGIAKVMEVEEEAAAVEELTSEGALIGTPRYMSPEQIRGDRLTPASDIYSLGLVAYELLTARKAVPQTTTIRMVARHLDPNPLRFPSEADVDDDLRAIVEEMIAKRPEHRFQSARELLRTLQIWGGEDADPDALPYDRSDVADTLKMQAPMVTELGAESSADVLPPEEDGAFYAADTQMLYSEEVERIGRKDFEPGSNQPRTSRMPAQGDERRFPWVPVAVVTVFLVLATVLSLVALANVSEDSDGSPDGESATPAELPGDEIEVEPLEDSRPALSASSRLTREAVRKAEQSARSESLRRADGTTRDDR